MTDPWLCPNWETELPDWVPAEAWNAWVEMRIRIKKPMSIRARKQALKKLWGFKMTGYDIESMIDRSENGKWTDFWPKGEPTQDRLKPDEALAPMVNKIAKEHRMPYGKSYRERHDQANKVRAEGNHALAMEKMKNLGVLKE